MDSTDCCNERVRAVGFLTVPEPSDRPPESLISQYQAANEQRLQNYPCFLASGRAQLGGPSVSVQGSVGRDHERCQSVHRLLSLGGGILRFACPHQEG